MRVAASAAVLVDNNNLDMFKAVLLAWARVVGWWPRQLQFVQIKIFLCIIPKMSPSL